MVRKIIWPLALMIWVMPLMAQVVLPVYPDSLFSTYYHQRRTLFESLPQTQGDIIFVGNSITDGGEWSEMFGDLRIKNRGISGDISAGVMHRLQEVVSRKPAKIFLMIGTNDLARGITPDSLLRNFQWIAGYIREHSIATRLFIQSLLPVNDHFGKFSGHTSKAARIKAVNENLKAKADLWGYTYIDLFTSFSNPAGKLDERFTNDGLHLTGEGYWLWKHQVYPHVYDAQARPSLIPEPRQVQWKEERFPLFLCRMIVAENDSLQPVALAIQAQMKLMGTTVGIGKVARPGVPIIKLQMAKVDAPQYANEAYTLRVGSNSVVLSANTLHGLFNAGQTLMQLMRSGAMIDGCDIKDWPAFGWRGYMVDVGRNYQPLSLLKQQIDIMARYKFNVFHFHVTEDIAWRLAIRKYPQLTAPQFMERQKGMFYTEAEMKELIRYCRERFITLVPEIDMPGHSAAFTRAMKVNMQSDSGLQIVKEILQEFCATYDLPYLHIGADEVKITNRNFIPEVTATITNLGKKVIAWDPGGNITAGTIRQLWLGDESHRAEMGKAIFIDSRHLYLNHMDPLESVATLYHRKIGAGVAGDHYMWGATLCLWHDRAVANADDVISMNPVYPGMLAFAERCWQGGGSEGFTAVIGPPESDKARDFMQFENRLLDHKRQYFATRPFPYVKQSSMTWQLYGPYANKGNLAQSFAPELADPERNGTPAWGMATGGTVVLRHWWAPLIQGVLQAPRDSSTWYATAKIWSDEDKLQPCWIGFNDLSRSPATDSPLPGTWDNKQSKIWVNGKEIPPPVWIHGGQKGHPEIPLADEGYAFRAPIMVRLHKGWNNVLVKAPVGSLKGPDWQNPVKWMFTFVQVHE